MCGKRDYKKSFTVTNNGLIIIYSDTKPIRIDEKMYSKFIVLMFLTVLTFLSGCVSVPSLERQREVAVCDFFLRKTNEHWHSASLSEIYKSYPKMGKTQEEGLRNLSDGLAFCEHALLRDGSYSEEHMVLGELRKKIDKKYPKKTVKSADKGGKLHAKSLYTSPDRNPDVINGKSPWVLLIVINGNTYGGAVFPGYYQCENAGIRAVWSASSPLTATPEKAKIYCQPENMRGKGLGVRVFAPGQRN